MSKSIIEVKRSEGRHSSCNTCGKNADRGAEVHEISLGINHQSTTVCMCTECLGKFADKLWEYLS